MTQDTFSLNNHAQKAAEKLFPDPFPNESKL